VLRRVIVLVVIYAATMMLRSARAERRLALLNRGLLPAERTA
jgi:hypothetical protein